MPCAVASPALRSPMLPPPTAVVSLPSFIGASSPTPHGPSLMSSSRLPASRYDYPATGHPNDRRRRERGNDAAASGGDDAAGAVRTMNGARSADLDVAGT
jgi:hypothetical protein